MGFLEIVALSCIAVVSEIKLVPPSADIEVYCVTLVANCAIDSTPHVDPEERKNVIVECVSNGIDAYDPNGGEE